MERMYYEAYDDRYRQVHSLGLKWFDGSPSQIVGQIITEFVIRGKCLELGCGEGRDAGYLLRHGLDLLATDISGAAIAFCREKDPEHRDSYLVLDCVNGRLDGAFDFIYAVAVVHMLVEDTDRGKFYGFIREHLTDAGLALICTMGDGNRECRTEASAAFRLQDRIHEPSGRHVRIAATSYRAVSFPAFRREMEENGLTIVKEGMTDIQPDYFQIMYAVVKKS